MEIPGLRKDNRLLEAEKILKRLGYKIRGKNKKAPVVTSVNDRDISDFVQADLLAKKKRKDYVVEVKEGEFSEASDPLLRRRLQELKSAFKTHGIIIVNLNRGEIHKILFRFPKIKGEFFVKIIIFIFTIAVIVGIIWLLTHLRLI
jgi:hypothetical protein